MSSECRASCAGRRARFSAGTARIAQMGPGPKSRPIRTTTRLVDSVDICIAVKQEFDRVCVAVFSRKMQRRIAILH